MTDKLGTYITKLMTTALDNSQEEFVKNLALDELKRLNANIGEFLSKSLRDEMEQEEKPCCAKNKCKTKKKEKQLLQEEKENAK